MKKTQPDANNDLQSPSLPPTEQDHGGREKTLPIPKVGTAGETGQMPPLPATRHSYAGAEDEFPPLRGLDKTHLVDGSRGQNDTELPDPGVATLGGPSSGEKNETLGFSVDPNGDNTETSLPPGAERPGGTLPRVAGYEILSVLGQGGMGIVYKARQIRLDRFVALKMIRAGTGARPEDLARFEAEALAVAAIEHPHIIRIFEIGEHAGMPYCSLEYLSGGNLARKIGGKPQAVGEAARIVATLAGAMEMAHSRGIVHRDLKPANVLIGADGTLKVTDFGLVKRLEDDSSQTRTGSILGTPSYMSPEQANGETHQIGPAADQYALGAILYELLTGRPPFQGTSILDTLEQVRRKEPVPPSQLQTKIPRDLETICLKCLQKDQARRYSGTTALVEDLRRFLADEPILARPVSRPEQAWRWCVRNPVLASLIATAVTSLLIVVTVLASSSVTISRKNQALTASNVALAEAKTLAEGQRSKAVAKQKLAEDAARAANEQNRNAVDAEVSWIKVLEDNLRYVPGIQDVREKLLTDAIKHLEDSARAMTGLRQVVGWAPEDEDKNWRSLARAHQRLGEWSISLNRFEDAMEQFRHTDAIIETLARSSPSDPMAHFRLARSRRQLGFLAMQKLGDSAGGQTYLRQAIEINRKCLAEQPENDTFKRELANSVGQLAGAELLLGHLENTRDLLQEEAAIRESFSSALTDEEECRRELSGHYERFAELKLRMNELAEGERYYDLSTAIRREIVKQRPDFWPVVYDLARTYNNAAFLRFPRGRAPGAARELHHKAVELIEQRTIADPANLETKAVLAETLYFEATCALHSGDVSAAEAGYRRCLEIRKALVTEPNAKMPKVDLMVALARCGQHAEAAKIAEVLAVSSPADEHIFFQAACGYALAAGCVASDAALAKRYTSAAIDCLRKGTQAGWADAVSLEIDPDLDPIRKDAGFQAFLDEFRKTAKKGP